MFLSLSLDCSYLLSVDSVLYTHTHTAAAGVEQLTTDPIATNSLSNLHYKANYVAGREREREGERMRKRKVNGGQEEKR